MFMLLVAGLIGGAVTFATLWPHGVLTALISAPFGGSLFILLAGLFVASSRAKAELRQERSIRASQTETKAAA